VKEIKVVHVVNLDVSLKVHYGNYMKYLKDQGYSVSAITHPGSWLKQDTTIYDSIFVKIIEFPPRISPFNDLQTLWKLVKYFRKEQFDIVHTHTVKPGLLGRLAAKLSNVPVIIHTIHGFYSYEGMSPAQNFIFDVIERVGAACSDLLLSQNRQDIETAINKKICSPQKIHFLGNGINLQRFNPENISTGNVSTLRQSLGISPEEAVIGFIGRLVLEKGIIEFFEAAKILKTKGVKARYLVIGTPQKTKSSSVYPEEILKDYGLSDDVMLLGYREDIPELYALMDILAFPSHGREGVPRVVMESAAFGLPVVATKVRGANEAVKDKVTGILVPPRNGAALADGILTLLENPSMAAAIGANARLHAAKQFNERRFFHRTDIEYRLLIKSKLGTDIDRLIKPIPTV
jgi:glycosyltransferase involved in cell wall biosynthesis